MALTKIYLPSNPTTDAELRAIINAFHAGILAAGLVQTADTNQIDRATVTYPASNSTFATGSLIYRFNDTLQATRPVFLKIRFSRGTGAGTISIYAQTGTATDGAGNLTGVLGVLMNQGVPSVAGATFPSFVAGNAGAGGTGWLTFAWQVGHSTTTQSVFYAVSRTRNSLGEANGDGLQTTSCANAILRVRYVDHLAGATVPSAADQQRLAGTQPNTNFSTLAFNGETPVFPCQPARPYLDHPDLSVVIVLSGDMTTGQIFASDLAGAVRKYWCVGTMGATTGNQVTNALIGVRVE